SGKNVFLEHSIGLLEINIPRLVSFFAMPKQFNKLVGAELGLSMKSFNFFVNLSKSIIAKRREEGGKVKRNDLVQLMMDAFEYEDELNGDQYDNLTATVDNGE